MTPAEGACRPPTASETATDESPFVELLDAAMQQFAAERFVTQSRCVDHLLDLLNATDNPVLRRLTVGALSSIRARGVVRAAELHVALCVLSAAANVELAARGSEPACGCC